MRTVCMREKEKTHFVVRARNQIGFVVRAAVVDAVHTHLVLIQGEVGRGRVQAPDLNCVVERAGGECVAIFGVELDLHHEVGVAIVCL